MDSAIEAVEHSAFDHPLSLALDDDSSMVDVPKEKTTTVHHHHKEEFSDELLFKNRDFDTSQQNTSHHHHHSNGKAAEEVEDELFGGKRRSGASDVFGASTFEVTEAPVKKRVEPPALPVVAAAPSAPKMEEPAAPHEVEVEDDGEQQQVKAMVEFESFPPPMSERQAKRAASQRKSSSPRKSASNSNGFSFGLLTSASSSSSSSSSSTSTSSSTRSEGSEERDQVYDISIPITHIEESPNDDESYAVRTHHLFIYVFIYSFFALLLLIIICVQVYHVEFFSLASTEPKTVVKRFSQFYSLHEAVRLTCSRACRTHTHTHD